MKNFRILLFPFSILYGVDTGVRNFFYDKGIFKSKLFDIPVIVVGNLNTGGTGKTPHAEYFVNILKDHFQLAVLSRGYGRKTRGFMVANGGGEEDVGDEPMQMKRKFEDIIVAVGEDRVVGIETLLSIYPDTDLVILDDAFQHRRVEAGLNILLTAYNDLYTRDFILPMGNLRESRAGMKRAQVIIVTKCPVKIDAQERKRIIKEINPQPYQEVIFSYLKYDRMVSCNNSGGAMIDTALGETSVLLFTGIADAAPMISYLKKITRQVVHIRFGDHYKFGEGEMNDVIARYNGMASENKIIVTTEKDLMRLINSKLLELFKHTPFYYLPVTVGFAKEDERIMTDRIEKLTGRKITI